MKILKTTYLEVAMMEYSVYYYVSYPNLGDKVRVVRKWLESNIGKEYEDWKYEWGPYCFWFKNEEDKIKFILRWL